MDISLACARRLALRAQLGDGSEKPPKVKEGTAQIIEKVGYIQIDTIAVIQRAHHHTLWVRQPDYNPEMLHELQAVDRRVFEYWGHAASYLPIFDYRYYLPRMRRFPGKSSWEQRRLKEHGHLMKSVLRRIREEGPLGAKDFAVPPGSKRGPWWDWKPAKTALELLFWKGELMVTQRHNFQRIYDLTERVLPEGIDKRIPDNDELGRFLVRRALSAYGVAGENEIRGHIHGAADKKVIKEAITDLVKPGEVVPIKIDRVDDTQYYALTETLENSSELKPMPPRLFLLSPFDNLIIQRGRIKLLFGFDYSLECYLPASKRKYGYFSLPILWGEDFVGRLDPKADRKQKTLFVRNLIFEPEFNNYDEIIPPLAEKLKSLARFNGCERVHLENTSGAKFKVNLKKELESS